MTNLIRKSICASILIGLGVYVLLKIGNPIGPFLFAFGLLSICYLDLYLFTGKCGFMFSDNIKTLDILKILFINVFTGLYIGRLFGYIDNSIIDIAREKMEIWNTSALYFFKSLFCGIIMYISVYIYKQKSPIGVLFGVPLFIFCGFQHSIANSIILGISNLDYFKPLIVCIIGNWIGALLISFCIDKKEDNDEG